jgi:elongation factor G
MAVEEVGRLRTIALVGQGGCGKTQLAEAMLFSAGAISRLGRPDDGTAVMDFEPEEVARHISISTGFHHFSWKKNEVILADTPGYGAFLFDALNSLSVVDGAVLVVSPASDLKVEAEKIWQVIAASGIPRLAFVSRLDRERTSFEAALRDLEQGLGAKPVVLASPVGEETGFAGVIDLLSMKLLRYPDVTGKPREEELSGELAEQAEQARTRLCDAVAETDDALLEQYLEKGSLEAQALSAGLRAAVLAGKLTPVLCGSGAKNIGVSRLLDAIVALLPAPDQRPARQGAEPATKQPVSRPADPKAPMSALVFKTVVDPYAGKLSILRVVSGRLLSDAAVLNASRSSKERLGQLLRLEGRKQAPLAAALPGEIAAVAKLKETATGDSLCDEKAPVLFAPLARPVATISFAIRPKAREDEEKASLALQRMVEEDPALETRRDPQTREIILSGTDQMHLEVTIERLKRKFGVAVELHAPKVPYKETIKSKAEAQGKYKRQSGGRGQYGDCWLRLEPLARSAGVQFEDEIVGGAIPRQYIPSVEKGVRHALNEGLLAGYPMVDLRVSVFDGSHHEVDSSDMAFQIAASMGVKNAVEKARPVLLEPVLAMEVSCPSEHLGDVIGDLNSRRGKVLGMDRRGANEVVRALVPMAEVLKYSSDLRSMTSGRGSFESRFSHYEEVPAPIAEKVIKEARAAREALKERAQA